MPSNPFIRDNLAEDRIEFVLASTGRYRSLVAIERNLASTNPLGIDRAVLKGLDDSTLRVTIEALEELC